MPQKTVRPVEGRATGRQALEPQAREQIIRVEHGGVTLFGLATSET
ncbi:hypothetical protein ABGB14_42565 [Nonomuraea sp. B10E15]